MTFDRTSDCFIIFTDHKSKFFSNPSIFVYRTFSICLGAPNRRRPYVCAPMSALLCRRSYVCALMSALLCLRSFVSALLSCTLLTGHHKIQVVKEEVNCKFLIWKTVASGKVYN